MEISYYVRKVFVTMRKLILFIILPLITSCSWNIVSEEEYLSALSDHEYGRVTISSTPNFALGYDYGNVVSPDTVLKDLYNSYNSLYKFDLRVKAKKNPPIYFADILPITVRYIDDFGDTISTIRVLLYKNGGTDTEWYYTTSVADSTGYVRGKPILMTLNRKIATDTIPEFYILGVSLSGTFSVRFDQAENIHIR